MPKLPNPSSHALDMQAFSTVYCHMQPAAMPRCCCTADLRQRSHPCNICSTVRAQHTSSKLSATATCMESALKWRLALLVVRCVLRQGKMCGGHCCQRGRRAQAGGVPSKP